MPEPSISFYISQCAQGKFLDELDDVKRGYNKMLVSAREDLVEKKYAIVEAEHRYKYDRTPLPNGGSWRKALDVAISDHDFNSRMLKNLELENNICNAFYEFVQQCRADTPDEEEARTVIRAAIFQSEKLNTYAETLRFWTLGE